ncbi:lutropin-choriogonadotropic hormone receptor [Hypomesus transpacificus]|uniref:lutropin-choriogonadotropic hormone receptor n=1 Tax=Hypomesus transpacificus TaxID=137520 RepID=UPI001F08204E|nr:lutropin-choriogonadotropic hormone receptor [Hypomesus transpacificus]
MWTSRAFFLFTFLLLPFASLDAWMFECPGICRCFPGTIRCNNLTERSAHVPQRLLVLKHLNQKTISSLSFDSLGKVEDIVISQSIILETMETLAFNNLPSVSYISIQNIRSLVHIGKKAFNNLPKLRHLGIFNTGIHVFTDLTSVCSLEQDFILYICDNLHILSIPPNHLAGMTRGYVIMKLFNNGIREIHDYAFNGTKIHELVLNNNRNLQKIHVQAFQGAEGPEHLDVSSTAIETLPLQGLEQVHTLVAQGAFRLKRLPPFTALPALTNAQLTYNSHCCALHTWNTHRDDRVNAASPNDSTYRNDNNLSFRVLGVGGALLPPLSVGPNSSDLLKEAAYVDEDFQYSLLTSAPPGPVFQCSPEADAFNPCEDLVNFPFLRVAIWFISLLAIVGNLTVLLVLFTSHDKLSVPRFLMCHLAFADFCIAIYLLMIASVDLRTSGHYSTHAIEWQTGPGCSVAGFLSVFGGELSVYTLATITLERWHTITHALQLERRLALGQAAGVMAGGWLLCLGLALLPLVGVSSYSKVSMCLPMDVLTGPAQAFILLLLLFNVGAFLVVCVCYVLIYLAVRNPEFPGRSADTKIAKRMAILIFTDLLCMAPISFFAISAAFKAPLITVTNSKILLVLFFPINSCANPFLYGIFTRAFRRDAYLALSGLGCCESKASTYRMKAYSSENVMKSSSGSSLRGPHAALRMVEIQQQTCILNQEEETS